MSRYWNESKDDPNIALILRDVAILLVFLAALFAAGCPRYNVWEQGLAGQAALARAAQDRQIAVQEALAKKEAATMLAEAEVERAKGVAAANKIIGDSLHNNEDYLRYLFVTNLENTKDQVIYVPTETNLPILEATRKLPQPVSTSDK